ncbi:hypothetical protein SIL80_05620 [Bacillus cereus group sp. BfR-BA-01119]|uniref:hypothetical protein n=1 Tax=Bacillus cereus group sp. BfR-BA-01119 TaxID=3094878 RepID=UPI0029C53551|nr:hypothetical protein [Bacillus cereus group sp. BfR-BA-01119]MDX5865368.1 hypothetical protein [Bacillus cereus group sp. BfR-BA-01119]
MEKWPEKRIEAYKHYVKTDLEVLKGCESRMKALRKELQDLEKQRERKIAEVERQVTQLYYQGWEMRRSEWVRVTNTQ